LIDTWDAATGSLLDEQCVAEDIDLQFWEPRGIAANDAGQVVIVGSPSFPEWGVYVVPFRWTEP
jgi:hypothetical protein